MTTIQTWIDYAKQAEENPDDSPLLPSEARSILRLYNIARDLRRALVRARQDGAVDPELLERTKWLEDEGK